MKYLNKLKILWTFNIPSVLIWIALMYAVFISGEDFFKNGNFVNTLIIYLTGIGLSVAISSTVLTYAQCKNKKKEELIKIGQLFLYASISLIMALLISWLSFKTNEKIMHLPFYNITHIIISIIFSTNFMFFLFSVNSFQAGIKKLDNHLFFEVKDDIK